MTLLHSPIDINRFWGLPPEEFDIQSFIAENLKGVAPMMIAPERGLGRRAMIDMYDPEHKKLIQVFSEVVITDSPISPLGYQEEDLLSFEGIVVGDVDVGEDDEITYWGAVTYSHQDFESNFVTDRGFSIMLSEKLRVLKQHSNKVDAILEQADELWSNRELGQTGVNPEVSWIC